MGVPPHNRQIIALARSTLIYYYQGPDEEKIKAILDRTGYSLDVTTGQRKYGGPPPDWEGSAPGNGCEVGVGSCFEKKERMGNRYEFQVFCGKIPKDMYEDELIPHFEKCGKIWDLRLMMDPMSGLNRCCQFYFKSFGIYFFNLQGLRFYYVHYS